ncbi:hypothetical protein [Nitrosopumilus sp.]|uniref:hypothetical protein n=1 Tax=Nitrosopumilus sp. TaxID=2024843 RepID=UPI003D0C3A8B
MNNFKFRQIEIKNIDLLISKNIGDKERLESIQMKLARGLHLFSENRAYVDALILENLSNDEIEEIKNQVKSVTLEKSEFNEQSMTRCICCGNPKKSLDSGGMCTECYYEYRMKISRFITKPMGNMGFLF